MALPTPEQFLQKHPEFRNAGETLIGAAINDAAACVSEAEFGARYDMAIRYKACALLADGTYGQVTPLPNKGQQTKYQERWDRLVMMIPRMGTVT